MSYIRALEEPDWEEGIGTGYYVYSDGNRINYLPTEHRPFVEVVMRMLGQSGELDQESLDDAHSALRTRLRIEDGSTGRTKPDIDDAMMGIATAVAYCNNEDFDESKDELETVYDRLHEVKEMKER